MDALWTLFLDNFDTSWILSLRDTFWTLSGRESETEADALWTYLDRMDALWMQWMPFGCIVIHKTSKFVPKKRPRFHQGNARMCRHFGFSSSLAQRAKPFKHESLSIPNVFPIGSGIPTLTQNERGRQPACTAACGLPKLGCAGVRGHSLWVCVSPLKIV